MIQHDTNIIAMWKSQAFLRRAVWRGALLDGLYSGLAVFTYLSESNLACTLQPFLVNELENNGTRQVYVHHEWKCNLSFTFPVASLIKCCKFMLACARKMQLNSSFYWQCHVNGDAGSIRLYDYLTAGCRYAATFYVITFYLTKKLNNSSHCIQGI